jgi:rhamnosyltransferase
MSSVRAGPGRDILVSIIILTKNGAKTIRPLLDGLRRQNLIERAEVIVIDSGSTDDTLAIVSEYPVALTQIPPREFGHGRTRNLGARLARGEFLLYVPQDATPLGPGWLEALLLPFEDSAVAGAYSRQVPRSDASAMESSFLLGTYTPRPEVRMLAKGEEASLSRCFFSTVGGVIRASLWKEHPFREDVIMSEDQAWSAEVMLAGHSIAYQPAAELLHSHQYGIADIFRRNFDSGYSIHQIFARRTGISAIEGLSRLAREAMFVLRAGSITDILRFPFYECARHFGFWMGMHAESLPVGMRKACGSLAYFWDQPPAPGTGAK